jgi:hypothetical protein
MQEPGDFGLAPGLGAKACIEALHPRADGAPVQAGEAGFVDLEVGLEGEGAAAGFQLVWRWSGCGRRWGRILRNEGAKELEDHGGKAFGGTGARFKRPDLGRRLDPRVRA